MDSLAFLERLGVDGGKFNDAVIQNGELGPTAGVANGQAHWVFDIEPDEPGNTPLDVTGMEELSVYFTMRTNNVIGQGPAQTFSSPS
jgi:hypothetical protein